MVIICLNERKDNGDIRLLKRYKFQNTDFVCIPRNGECIWFEEDEIGFSAIIEDVTHYPKEDKIWLYAVIDN